jgi:hypothetical protein
MSKSDRDRLQPLHRKHSRRCLDQHRRVGSNPRLPILGGLPDSRSGAPLFTLAVGRCGLSEKIVPAQAIFRPDMPLVAALPRVQLTGLP